MASRRHVKRWMIGGLVVAHTVAAAGAVTWWAVGRAPVPAPDGNLETLGVYGTVPPFSLTERSGRRITREDLRGLVWVVDFIYTGCTETCPLQSLEFARLQRDFGQAADLRLVSITVDPEHDTVEVLRAYAGRYGADDRWWFLTGDKRAIACLAQEGFRLGVVDPAAPTPPECRKAVGLGPAPAWAGLAEWRRALIVGARGRVLDIGSGTGRSLPLLPDGAAVVGLDPSLDALRRARPRAPSVPLVVGRAEALPFRDGVFDTVLSGLVFCSVDDPQGALAEVRRVLRPPGRLRMLEHVRSPVPWRARLQDLIQPLWTRAAGGCRPNRDTEVAVERAGFQIEAHGRRARGSNRLFSARPGSASL